MPVLTNTGVVKPRDNWSWQQESLGQGKLQKSCG